MTVPMVELLRQLRGELERGEIDDERAAGRIDAWAEHLPDEAERLHRLAAGLRAGEGALVFIEAALREDWAGLECVNLRG